VELKWTNYVLQYRVGGSMPPTRKISIRLTEKYYEMLEILVEIGEFTSVSEAIREAVKLLIEKYEEKIEGYVKYGRYR